MSYPCTALGIRRAWSDALTRNPLKGIEYEVLVRPSRGKTNTPNTAKPTPHKMTPRARRMMEGTLVFIVNPRTATASLNDAWVRTADPVAAATGQPFGSEPRIHGPSLKTTITTPNEKNPNR